MWIDQSNYDSTIVRLHIKDLARLVWMKVEATTIDRK